MVNNKSLEKSEGKPFVSVITPVYNRREVVTKTIESVLSQTYKNYELVVIDDASADGTADFVSQNYPGIKLIRLAKNKGAAGARNEGIKIAKGEFIAFLDSDDQWLPDFLEEQIKALQKNKKACLAFCDFFLIKDGSKKEYVNSQPDPRYKDMIHQLLMRNFISTMSLVMVRHNILKEAGFFNEGLKISHDRELYLRLLHYGKAVHIPKNLVLRYLGSDNLVKDYKLWSKDVMLLLKIFFSDKRSKPYRNIKSQAKSQWALYAGGAAKLNKDLIYAFRMWSLAAYYSLFSFKSFKQIMHLLGALAIRLTPQSIKDRGRILFLQKQLKNVERLETPRSIVFFITNRCNARCRHCFYWKQLDKNLNELSLGQIKEFVLSLRETTSICLTGGEPFLREDIVKICKIFCEHNGTRIIVITTNGFAPDLIYDKCKYIAKQCNLKNLTIPISLDGLEKTHDKIRGIKDGFNKAIGTINKLLELRKEYGFLNLEINTIIMRDNYDEIERLVKFTQRFKIPHKFSIVRGAYSTFGLSPLVASEFNPKEEKERVVPLEDLEELYNKVCKLNDSLEYKFLSNFQKKKLRLSLDILKTKTRIIPCFAGRIDGVILPNGDVAFCEFTKPIGNLKETSFDFYKLWNSKKANDVKKQITKCECIHGCNLSTSLGIVPKYKIK